MFQMKFRSPLICALMLALTACGAGDGADQTAASAARAGGATADAVGRRLAALAEGGQVLVVTHSPQVAARGGHHWRVEKDVADGVTTSRVVPLDTPGRVDEIARMLAELKDLPLPPLD